MSDLLASTATAPPQSPPARRVARARWLDLRLITGVLLVLVSVVIGARVVSASQSSEPVWLAARDLAAGTELSAADLVRGQVHLYGKHGSYVSAKTAAPVGYVLTRPVGQGELLPVAAIAAPGRVPEYRLVTVQVTALHLPLHLGAGDRVDVYVTPHAVGAQAMPSRLVYAGAVVQGTSTESHGFSAGTGDTAVVLQVPPRAVADVLAGIHGGDVDLVLVPPGQT
jgi:hypothetical protein